MSGPNKRLEHPAGEAKRGQVPADVRTVNKDHVVGYLKTVLPDIDAVLRQMEKDGGWLRLPAKAVEAFARLNISNYAENYADERRVFALFALVMGGEGDGVQQMLWEIGEAYESNPDAFVAEAVKASNELDAQIEKAFSLTDAERELAKAKFEGLPEDERKAEIRKAQLWTSFLVLMFFQLMALMVHGRKMTALVADAIAGDDDAYCKAVQVDRSILVAIPYFGQRLRRAHLEGDRAFCERLGYRMANPVLKGKIRYRTLWIVFSFLELFGLLNGSLRHQQILDICDAVGVGGRKSRIEDVGYLSKRLAEYRRFQRKGARSTHSKTF
jgi:hypothetical protein